VGKVSKEKEKKEPGAVQGEKKVANKN